MQVVPATVEDRVLLLADQQVQVTVRAAAQADLRLAAHADLRALAGACRNVDAEGAARGDASRAGALRAGLGDRGAEPLTRGAGSLGLHASKERVLDLRDETGTVASRALLGGGARLAHRAVAGVAQNVRLEGDFLGGAECCVLEGDVDGDLLVLAASHARGRALRGGAEAAGEHGLENVGEAREGGAPTRAAAAQGVGAADVVHLALLGVGEGLVGDRQLLEGFLRVGARVVGVELTRQLAVRLLNLVLAGVSGDAEDLVIVSHACCSFSWGAFVGLWWAVCMVRCLSLGPGTGTGRRRRLGQSSSCARSPSAWGPRRPGGRSRHFRPRRPGRCP